MPISKLRRQAATDSQPTASTGEWKWFSFFGDALYFNTDAGTTRHVLTDNVEVLTAADTLTANESGKTIFLNSATEFAVTLPAPAAGLRFTFIVTAAPSGASYTIVTASSAQIIFGGQHDAGGAAGDVESTGGATTITFVDGQAVVGDRADLISDGTNWYARVFTNVAAGATFTG